MSEFGEVSRAAYEEISRDDLEGFLARADPDVEFNSLIEGRSYRGHEGVREWWNNVIKFLVGGSLELDEVFDFGDHGYVKMLATSDAGDVRLPQAIWQAIPPRGRQGRVVGIFRTEGEARKALGVKKKR